MKDVQVLHQSFIQSSKNFYNHILESLLVLLDSMSSNLLITIFNDVIVKFVFQDFISSELRVYLLKFADKIVHICKGNLVLNQSLLTNILKFMLPG